MRAVPGTFKLSPVRTYDEAITAMAMVTRKVGLGEIDVDRGWKLVGMLSRLVTAINYRRKSELEDRRLDLLGAAAERGDAVFEGLAIIPPRPRDEVHPSAPSTPETASPPLIEMTAEPDEAMVIKPPRSKKYAKRKEGKD